MAHTSDVTAVEQDDGETYFTWIDASGGERRLRVTHLPLMPSPRPEDGPR